MKNDISLHYAQALGIPGSRASITSVQLRRFMNDQKRLITPFQESIRKKDIEFINHILRKLPKPGWKEAAHDLKKASTGMLVIGMGGSSLGAKAIYEALAPFQKNMEHKLFFLDNVDPEKVSLMLGQVDLARCAVNVVTKSGETLETVANFLLVLEKLRRESGKSCSSRIVVTTQSEYGDLADFARKMNIRVIPLEKSDSGRYSVLGPTGLFPLHYCGIDTEKLLCGARRMLQRCFFFHDYKKNPAIIYAALKRMLLQKGKKIEVIFAYSSLLEAFQKWYVQLLAESSGKKYNVNEKVVNEGQTPLPATGASDQHSLLQLFLEGKKDKIVSFWEIGEFRQDLEIPQEENFQKDFQYIQGKKLGEILHAEKSGTEFSLIKAGVPSITIRIPRIDEHCLGQLIALLEMQVFFFCRMAQVDPFNQPGVEMGKRASREILTARRRSKINVQAKDLFKRKNRFVV